MRKPSPATTMTMATSAMPGRASSTWSRGPRASAIRGMFVGNLVPAKQHEDASAEDRDHFQQDSHAVEPDRASEQGGPRRLLGLEAWQRRQQLCDARGEQAAEGDRSPEVSIAPPRSSQ